jgi:uncharacterized protein (DUF1697 family)
MAELRALCEEAGLSDVTTYIQSGNVVFTSKLARARIQKKLESALAAKLGKSVGVMLRTPEELAGVLEKNPFERADPSRVIVFFLEAPLAKSEADGISIPANEELSIAGTEAYVHYPDGQGRSKLKLPFARMGTGRNLNTVRKLLEMASGV